MGVFGVGSFQVFSVGSQINFPTLLGVGSYLLLGKLLAYTQTWGLRFFAMAILSQNHREIDITKSILVSRKVIMEGVFPVMSLKVWPPV